MHRLYNKRQKLLDRVSELNKQIRIERAHKYIKKYKQSYVINKELGQLLCNKYPSNYKCISETLSDKSVLIEFRLSKTGIYSVKSVDFCNFKDEIDIDIDGVKYANFEDIIKEYNVHGFSKGYIFYDSEFVNSLILDNETINYGQYMENIISSSYEDGDDITAHITCSLITYMDSSL